MQGEESYYTQFFKDYPDVLTVSEAADMLQVCKKTIYRLIKENKIGANKIGNGYRIPKIFVIYYLITNKPMDMDTFLS